MTLPPRVRRAAIVITLMLVFVAMAAAATWQWTQSMLDAPGPHSTEIIVDLPKGASLAGIAVRLQNAGVIEQAALFRGLALVSGQSRQLKAGEYAFPAQASVRMMLAQIAAGKILLHRISIPEGLTSQQIQALVAQTEPLTGTLPATVPEGSLLPETYLFARGESRQAMIARMQAAQKNLLERLWRERGDNALLQSPQEALILASIVEKETGIAAERPLIAGVFFNRLRIGMALQSDPTVVYARDQGAPSSTPLSRKDLAIDSPFNSYKYPGLPPAPIANPGYAALLAVLHPAATNALYFAADGTGGHAFADNLNDHNANVAKLRAREKARRKESSEQ